MKLWIWLLAAGGGILVSWLAWRVSRWLRLMVNQGFLHFSLAHTPEGRSLLKVSWEIKMRARRIKETFKHAEMKKLVRERSEFSGILTLVEQFLEEELPLAMTRGESYIKSGGHLTKEQRMLQTQEGYWAQATSDERKMLEKGIARLRENLALTTMANEGRDRVIQSLQGAAGGMKLMELELAQWGEVRKPVVENFKTQMEEATENLRHEKEALLELEEKFPSNP